VHAVVAAGAAEAVAVAESVRLAFTGVSSVVVIYRVVTPVAQPVWHVGHGPSTATVGVEVQHESEGGRKTVLVSSRIQSGWTPLQESVGQPINIDVQ